MGIVSCVWLGWKGLTGGWVEECCQPLGILHTGKLRMDEVTTESLFCQDLRVSVPWTTKFLVPGLSNGGCGLTPDKGASNLENSNSGKGSRESFLQSILFFF